jgi:hypothetical protein
MLTATIGVRDSGFTVGACSDQAKCGDLFGVPVAVIGGGISFRNQTAEIDIDRNVFTQIQTVASGNRRATGLMIGLNEF